ncbi:uncharacterized protein LOC117923730 [Vitis riparia]|uniref:uncharacterized protein LOC117923730 n=1 Tax=Vitis riparia TaxID=96939 RepID=UPI00155A1281|nr:uncharacterized protein LOC117923730 [Vitis riparia]
MPAVWFALKRSLHCKSEPSDVYDPKAGSNLSAILTKKTGRSGCSRSISNLKDVIHGSKRHIEKPATCSPRSIGSSELLNPITHEVVLNNSTCELKITGFGGAFQEGNGGGGAGAGAGAGSTFVGTLKPGTPGPGGHHIVPSPNPRRSASQPRRPPTSSASFGVTGRGVPSHPRASLGAASNSSSSVTCHKCGEQFKKLESVEEHHLSKHAVTELVEGDSSRKIVEIICRTSWLKSENSCGRIERVLKVHNMQKTLARFEEYREIVKIKASKLPKKHPRCLADGNELLRFHGTTIACSLGMNGSSSLCTSDKCSVCRILRHGFSTKKEVNGGVGVFTTSTSGSAFELIKLNEENQSLGRALIVCRVIAGRVHRPLENIQELAGQSGFDSLAGKVGVYSNIEELYLLNPIALLPCFVVICKP